MPASDVMDTQPTVLTTSDTIETAVEHVMRNRYRNLPVVDERGCYLGVFGVNHLLKMLMPAAVVMERGLVSASFVHGTLRQMREKYEQTKHCFVSECMDEQEPVYPDTPTLEALLVLYRTRFSVPVVDRETRCLVGMISYWDVGEHVLDLKLD